MLIPFTPNFWGLGYLKVRGEVALVPSFQKKRELGKGGRPGYPELVCPGFDPLV